MKANILKAARKIQRAYQQELTNGKINIGDAICMVLIATSDNYVALLNQTPLSKEQKEAVIRTQIENLKNNMIKQLGE